MITSAKFSRADACRIVGLSAADLARWEGDLAANSGLRLPEVLGFADVVSLAVLRVADRNMAADAQGFMRGFSELFAAMASTAGLEALDGYAVVVGRDFARLSERDAAICLTEDVVVIHLRPILSELRDLAFA